MNNAALFKRSSSIISSFTDDIRLDEFGKERKE
jgi:hypothetical protein